MKKVARAVALVGISGGLLQTAWADDATTDQSGEKAQKIEVVGSNIKRVNAETSAPVQIIKREDIDRQGVTSVTQLINNLSAATGNNTLSDIGGSNSFAPGASSAGLRNLGEQSTLILLNGRRVAPNGLADFNLVFANLDAFPIDAVERVEVLKSGASAIYGSDAVAGVINIVTRKDFTGVDVHADHEQSITSGKFGTSTASITGGMGDLAKDHYNVFLNLDAYHRDSVMWDGLLGYINKNETKAAPLFGKPSTYSPYTNFYDVNGVVTGAQNTDGFLTTGPNCPTGTGTSCLYNKYQRIQAVPKSDRANAYLSGQLELHDGLTAFGEAGFSQDKTSYISPYMTYGVQAAQTLLANGTSFYDMGLNAQSPLNPLQGQGPVEFRYRFADAPTYQNDNNTQYRVLGGLRGTAGNYDWESAIGVMGSRAVDSEAGRFSATGFNQEIGCYLISCSTANINLPGNGTISNDPNFFNQPGGYRLGGPNSAAVLNTLFPEYGSTGQYTQTFWDGKVSGPIAELSTGTLAFAAGAELRHEKYTITPTSNLASGDIVGFGTTAADGQRTFGAAFGELSVPVTKKLEAQLAARVDKFPNIEAHVSPKLGLRFEATDFLLFRGTIETGFRAPNLVESANSTKQSYASGVSDPLRCNAANALINDLSNAYNALNPNSSLAQSILARIDSVNNNECAASLNFTTKSNPNLKPETSKSGSLGMVIEPLKGLSASVDYWHIKRANTISELSGQQIVTLYQANMLPAGSSLNRYPVGTPDPSFSTRDGQLNGQNDFTVYHVPTDSSGNYITPIQSATTQFSNIYSQKTDGVDFNIKGRMNTAVVGRVDLDWNATYTVDYHDASITNYGENLVGQYGFPRLVSDLTIASTKGAYTNGLRFNYTSGQQLQTGSIDSSWTPAGCAKQGFTAGQCMLNYNLTTDYFFSYKGIKSLTVNLNIINMFNQKSPADIKGLVQGGQGVFPPQSALQDAEGRMLKVGLDYRFN